MTEYRVFDNLKTMLREAWVLHDGEPHVIALSASKQQVDESFARGTTVIRPWGGYPDFPS